MIHLRFSLASVLQNPLLHLSASLYNHTIPYCYAALSSPFFGIETLFSLVYKYQSLSRLILGIFFIVVSSPPPFQSYFYFFLIETSFWLDIWSNYINGYRPHLPNWLCRIELGLNTLAKMVPKSILKRFLGSTISNLRFPVFDVKGCVKDPHWREI